MKTKLPKLITIIATLVVSIISLVAPVAVYADDYNNVCNLSTVSDAVKAAYGCPGTDQGSKEDFSNALQGILNGIIASLGLVAVIIIVIGGVMYMTSAGDAGKLQKAKTTILSAAIGLIICVLAFAIVNFVIINIIHGGNTA